MVYVLVAVAETQGVKLPDISPPIGGLTTEMFTARSEPDKQPKRLIALTLMVCVPVAAPTETVTGLDMVSGEKSAPLVERQAKEDAPEDAAV